MTHAPAGWYVDPWNPSSHRYWNGLEWTGLHAGAQTEEAPPTAPAGTRWSTIWIWLIVALPLLDSLRTISVALGELGSNDRASSPASVGEAPLLLSFGPSLLSLLPMLLPYVILGLCVFSAYRDYRVLIDRGVPKPFHWAWAFLSPAYAIGRSIVVKRRTGHGMPPLWVAVADLAATFVIFGVTTITAFNELDPALFVNALTR